MFCLEPLTPNIDYFEYSPPASVAYSQTERVASRNTTKFITATKGVIDFFTSSNGPEAPTVTSDFKTVADVTRISNEIATVPETNTTHIVKKEVEQIAAQRVELLARKYVGQTKDAEIIARLEILNQRLLWKAPRVTEEQVSALEFAEEQLLKIRANREERSKRLGIPN